MLRGSKPKLLKSPRGRSFVFHGLSHHACVAPSTRLLFPSYPSYGSGCRHLLGLKLILRGWRAGYREVYEASCLTHLREDFREGRTLISQQQYKLRISPFTSTCHTVDVLLRTKIRLVTSIVRLFLRTGPLLQPSFQVHLKTKSARKHQTPLPRRSISRTRDLASLAV